MHVKYNKVFEVSCTVVECLKQRYKKYEKYLNDDFYNELQNELPKYYDPRTNIALDVYLKVIGNNLIINKLCEIARSGELDVEIELISDYKSILRWMMNQKHIKEDLYLKKGEDVLIKAIETYGSDNKIFLKHIYSCVKREFKDEIEVNSIERKANCFVENNEIIQKQPEYIELVAKELDIIKYVPNNYKVLNQFVYLKYGYNRNIYFTLDEIQKMLKINDKQVITCYKNSINLLNDIINLYLNEKKDERIIYAKKLLSK